MTRHRLPDRPHTKPTASLVLELCAHVMAYKLDAEMLKCTCFSLVPATAVTQIGGSTCAVLLLYDSLSGILHERFWPRAPL
jgi:hypothetical protein